MPKHLIIGLGWLGSPLAQHLLSAGDDVAGTTRNEEKRCALSKRGIECYIFDLYTSEIESLPRHLFDNANVVINIPPGRLDYVQALFIERMQQLFEHAAKSHAKHICFISTTSVFGGLSGRVSNTSPLQPTSPSGEAHAALETYLSTLAAMPPIKLNRNTQFTASVLRLAGLVGPNRHPITSLSQKSNIALGQNPVNLIHQTDVITVISCIINKADNANLATESTQFFEGNIFIANLCAIEHPSRAKYYTWCAEQLGIRIPDFAADSRVNIDGKWIDAKATLTALNIELEYASPYQMLS